MGKLGKILRNILIVCGALFILLGCGCPDGFYGCMIMYARLSDEADFWLRN